MDGLPIFAKCRAVPIPNEQIMAELATMAKRGAEQLDTCTHSMGQNLVPADSLARCSLPIIVLEVCKGVLFNLVLTHTRFVATPWLFQGHRCLAPNHAVSY